MRPFTCFSLLSGRANSPFFACIHKHNKVETVQIGSNPKIRTVIKNKTLTVPYTVVLYKDTSKLRTPP